MFLYYQGCKVRHGKGERVFRLEYVSNQEFTDAEFQKWIEASHAADTPMPSREEVAQKQADIKEALNYEYNEKDVDRIVSNFHIIPNQFYNFVLFYFYRSKKKKDSITKRLITL